MKRRVISIGVLGCASIADRSVIPAIRKSADVNLIAVASRDPARAADFAIRHDAQACTYDELLERDDIESVYVPLPVGLHHLWGARVLAAGKHLLLEKTFTERLAQSVDLVSAASASGLVAMEALMYRFHPVHAQLRTLVLSGAIGELRHIDAHFGMPLLPPNDIRRRSDLGGGASLDSLVYPLSLCLELAGRAPTGTHVRMLRDSSGIDIRGAVQSDWESVSAQMVYGVGFAYRNECRVWGVTGSIRLERAFTRPPDMPAELLVQTSEGVRTIVVPAADHFALMLRHFADRIRGDAATSPVEGDDLLVRMACIEGIREQGGMSEGASG
jgi:predicted dehydrogenase